MRKILKVKHCTMVVILWKLKLYFVSHLCIHCDTDSRIDSVWYFPEIFHGVLRLFFPFQITSFVLSLSTEQHFMPLLIRLYSLQPATDRLSITACNWADTRMFSVTCPSLHLEQKLPANFVENLVPTCRDGFSQINGICLLMLNFETPAHDLTGIKNYFLKWETWLNVD